MRLYQRRTTVQNSQLTQWTSRRRRAGRMETRRKVDEVGSGFEWQLKLKSCRLLENPQRNKGEQGFVCIQQTAAILHFPLNTPALLPWTFLEFSCQGWRFEHTNVAVFVTQVLPFHPLLSSDDIKTEIYQDSAKHLQNISLPCLPQLHTDTHRCAHQKCWWNTQKCTE